MKRTIYASCLAGTMLLGAGALAGVSGGETASRETSIRAGTHRTIVAVHSGASRDKVEGTVATIDFPFPHPRLVGFSPLVAITTSDAGLPLGTDFEFEHELEPNYVGQPLDPQAEIGFVVGYLDSGSDVNLVAGSAKFELGLYGSNLTQNSIAVGGVGGTVLAPITMPVGFFAAGLSAIDNNGLLDYSALVGHSNVCGLAIPSIDCGEGELVAAIMGNPFIAFHNTIIRVDNPQTVYVDGRRFRGPEVHIQQVWEQFPVFGHKVSMTFNGLSPLVSTANYFPDFQDLVTPLFPTLLSMAAGLIPSGGAFFATLTVFHGDPNDPLNTAQPMRVLVDTGAQSSIMSPGMAARLSLPIESDFSIDVCGVGGLAEGIPGYYVDAVRINALGGPLDFAEAPFVVLDLPSPDGGVLDGVLGMNFFWNRNIIFEPALGFSAFLHVSDPIAFSYADSDVDFDVDLEDAELFLSCVNGPASAVFVSPECNHLDIDVDGDLDLDDYGTFQRCFSGADVDADPDCGTLTPSSNEHSLDDARDLLTLKE